jgi:molybdate transport repressor ModE-like protein
MNWDDLKIILAVARCGTVSGAAKQLNVQHSTVSRRVKSLEKQLGTNLLRRKKGAYELTRAGKRIEAAALKIEKEIAAFDGALVSDAVPMVGPLRVTTINSLASTILMPIFGAFSRAYPEIDLHVMVSNDTVSLTNREADVAIRLSNAPPENMIGKRVVTIASTVYGSVEYLSRHRLSKSPLKWLGVSCCGFHKSWTKESSNSTTHQFNCDDALLTLAALHEGLGVSYLPCFVGDADARLERYCKPDARHDLGLWILLHPESKSNARLSVFRKFVADALKKEQRALFPA